MALGIGLGLGVGLRRSVSAVTIDADISAFTARLASNGAGALPGTQATALAALVAGLKADSLWSSIKYFWPCLGANSDLLAARTPLILGTSGPAILANTSFVNGDYTAAGGLVSATNTKWLDTGWAPANDSLDAANSFVGLVYTGDVLGTGQGSTHLCEQRTSAASRLTMRDANSLNGRGQSSAVWGKGIEWLNYASDVGQLTSGHGFGFGFKENAAAGSLTGNLAIFAGWNSASNVTYPGNGQHGGMIYGTGLTSANMRKLMGRLYTFYRAIGRIDNRSVCAVVGDSITRGTGATNNGPPNRYSRAYCEATGFAEMNYGVPSGKMIADFTISGGTSQIAPMRYQKYQEIIDAAPGRVVIMLGVNDRGGDATVGGTQATADDFRDKLIHCISALKTALPSARIVIGSAPYSNPVVATAHDLVKQSMYVASALAAAQNQSVFYADVNAYMQANGGNALLIGDGVHPNNTGMGVISTALQGATQQ